METVAIELSKGKIALIDAADLPLVSQYKWYAVEAPDTYYAAHTTPRREGRKMVLMHRLIAGADKSSCVDHRDGNGLNNTRDNLRICTHAQNCCNQRKNRRGKSRYKGVSPIMHKGEVRWWQANIQANGKPIYLGCYSSEEDAARAYNAAAIVYHKEFARLNQIDGLTHEESIAPPARNLKPHRSKRS